MSLADAVCPSCGGDSAIGPFCRACRRPLSAAATEPEADAQRAVVALLRLCRVVFAASLNGVRLSAQAAGRAKAAGMEPGEPDLYIHDRPPARPDCHGTALELKRADLAPRRPGTHPWRGCSPAQVDRLHALETRGWLVLVAHGSVDAVEQLRAAGYPLPEVGR